MKTVDEQYIRPDIACGVKGCPLCEQSGNANLVLKLQGQVLAEEDDSEMISESSNNFYGQAGSKESVASKIGKLFVIDHFFARNQIDILENCDILSNLVVSDTILRYLNRENIQTFHGLRNTLE